MTLRAATPADYPAILALHGEHGAGFKWPELERGSSMAVIVAEDGGKIVGAVMALRAAEIVMTVDRSWRTPAGRLAAVEAMQGAMAPVLRDLGVDCGYCWVPPQMRGWMRRMVRRLGWRKSDWVCMEHEL